MWQAFPTHTAPRNRGHSYLGLGFVVILNLVQDLPAGRQVQNGVGAFGWGYSLVKRVG